MSRRSNKPSTIPITPLAPTPLISISDDNSKVIALLPSGDRLEVLLYGATIVSWKPAGGRENLFLSEKAHLDGSKPVRGGIPVVFPLFGPPTPGHATEKLGQHGFARSSRWEYLGKTTSESSIQPGSAGDSSVKLDFGLSDSILNESVRAAWPHRFGLTYSITLTPGELETGLLVRNTDETPFEFKTLFHTYFKVDDISDVSITGLESATYHDKVASKPESAATGSALTFGGETDRVYSAGEAPITVLEGKEPLYEIKRDALPDVVTWNPWAEKAKSMADLGPEHGWKELVCVEAGAVAQWLKLEAGDTWYGGQRITAL